MEECRDPPNEVADEGIVNLEYNCKSCDVCVGITLLSNYVIISYIYCIVFVVGKKEHDCTEANLSKAHTNILYKQIAEGISFLQVSSNKTIA